MELRDVIKNRRSHREFADKLVSKIDIEKLVNAFSFAPTSCNLQLSSLILVNDKKLINLIKKKVTGKVSWTNQFFVLVINNSINYGNSAQEISAGMAVQNLMLQAEDMGIGTCPIAGFENKIYLKKLLNVPDNFDIPLLIFFGYKNMQPKNKLIIPYRAKQKLVLHENIFSRDLNFKFTNNLHEWTFDEIMEYRKRIFPVYYPRFKQGLWRDSLNLEFSYFLKNTENFDFLCYYFWEKGFLDLINKYDKIYVYDDFNDYVNFLKTNYDLKISNKFDSSKTFKYIFLANTLEFCKNKKEIFKDINLKLDSNGEATIIYFNYYGIFSLFFRFFRFIGLLTSVYEKSPFYKIGPYSFIKNSEINLLLKNNNLKIIKKKFINTSCLEDKFKNKFIKFILNRLNLFFPENIKLVVFKK
jgi:nitroreductase